MLTIEQVDGRLRLDLEGADLPDAPVSVPVRQRVSTSWAPGASRPVVQVLGVEHGTMTLRGMFADAQTRYESARSAMQTLEAMARAGRPVRMIWEDLLDRIGVLTRVEPRWEMLQIVGWELDFEPHEVEATAKQEAKLRAMQARPDAEAAGRIMMAAAVAALVLQHQVAHAATARVIAGAEA